VHVLRANHRDWTPATVAYLHSDTVASEVGTSELLTLRSWAVRLVVRRDRDPDRLGAADGDGDDAAGLAAWLDYHVAGRKTVWLFAADLAMQMTTTRLPLQLIGLGWSIMDAAVAGRSPWMKLGKGRDRLVMVDVHSWLPTPLDEIRRSCQLPKFTPDPDALPEDVADAAVAHELRTVEVAIGELMDWWDAGKLGDWSASGPACGWNTYRHTKTRKRPVIDPALERV